MIEEFTTADLIAELQEHYHGTRRPGGVVPAEWAKAQGIPDGTARMQLIKLMNDGLLTREKTMVDGRMVFVYYKAKPSAPSS